jgi:hypothetical protein
MIGLSGSELCDQLDIRGNLKNQDEKGKPTQKCLRPLTKTWRRAAAAMSSEYVAQRPTKPREPREVPVPSKT